MARQFEAAQLTPLTTWASQHNMWALLAYGRLAQCLAAARASGPPGWPTPAARSS